MTTWKFDILTPQYMPWKAGTYTLRAGSWEVNLMCHLLSKFGDYATMYGMEVAREDEMDGLKKLAEGTLSIPDEELALDVKERIAGLLAEIRQSFLDAYNDPHNPLSPKIMRDLWTWPDLNESVPHGVVAKFEKIQKELEKGTVDQSDPHHAGKKRFHRRCQACIPFLDVLKDTSKRVVDAAMKFHIDQLGTFSLEGLYKVKKSKLKPDQIKAIADAKTNGIFSRAGKLTAFLGSGKKDEEADCDDPGNDLKCIDGECQPCTDTFCSTAEAGGCSGMSD
ncbi:MAG TPA: hypothetical protein PKJ78_01025 [Candidatus Hydrogenedentes bacterium]|nr:hypothetical protein [Candidatus Hydrogenedentota bacterium]